MGAYERYDITAGLRDEVVASLCSLESSLGLALDLEEPFAIRVELEEAAARSASGGDRPLAWCVPTTEAPLPIPPWCPPSLGADGSSSGGTRSGSGGTVNGGRGMATVLVEPSRPISSLGDQQQAGAAADSQLVQHAAVHVLLASSAEHQELPEEPPRVDSPSAGASEAGGSPSSALHARTAPRVFIE